MAQSVDTVRDQSTAHPADCADCGAPIDEGGLHWTDVPTVHGSRAAFMCDPCHERNYTSGAEHAPEPERAACECSLQSKSDQAIGVKIRCRACGGIIW